MDKGLDLYVVGVGGQGVLTIAELITQAAYEKEIPVSFYPTKGMAQRGGFVKAQVRVGRAGIGPAIPQQGADVAVSMELSESLKAVRYARAGADFLVYAFRWEPAAVMLGKAPYPALEAVRAEILAVGARPAFLRPEQLPLHQGAPVRDNLYLLGAMLGGTRLREWFDPREILELVQRRWPKAAAENACALEAGLKFSEAESGAAS